MEAAIDQVIDELTHEAPAGASLTLVPDGSFEDLDDLVEAPRSPSPASMAATVPLDLERAIRLLEDPPSIDSEPVPVQHRSTWALALGGGLFVGGAAGVVGMAALAAIGLGLGGLIWWTSQPAEEVVAQATIHEPAAVEVVEEPEVVVFGDRVAFVDDPEVGA